MFRGVSEDNNCKLPSFGLLKFAGRALMGKFQFFAVLCDFKGLCSGLQERRRLFYRSLNIGTFGLFWLTDG